MELPGEAECDLGPAYEEAWAEWAADDDSELWESASGDRLMRPATHRGERIREGPRR